MKEKKTRPELLNNWNNYLHRIKFYTGNSVKVLKKINLDRVNFAFLDGSHNKTKVEIEFNWVKERQLKNDIIVFDDYDPHNFKGIYEFINNLEKENNYKITKIFSEMNRGYAIAKKLKKKKFLFFFSFGISLKTWHKQKILEREVSYYKKISKRKI